MALNKPQLRNDIIDLLTDLYENNANLTTAQAREAFADRLSTAIEDFVKSGDGKYQPGTLTAGSTLVTNPSGNAVVKIE